MSYFYISLGLSSLTTLLLIWLFFRSLRARRGHRYRSVAAYFRPAILAALLLVHFVFFTAGKIIDLVNIGNDVWIVEPIVFERKSLIPFKYIDSTGATFTVNPFLSAPELGTTYVARSTPATAYVVSLQAGEALNEPATNTSRTKPNGLTK